MRPIDPEQRTYSDEPPDYTAEEHKAFTAAACAGAALIIVGVAVVMCGVRG